MAPAQKLPSSAYAGISIGEKEIGVSILQGDVVSNFKTDRYSDLAYFLEGISEKEEIKIVAAALRGEGNLKKVGSKLWLKQDIVPLVINNNLEKTTEALAKFAASQFVDDIPKINLGPDNKVQVGELVTLDDYRKVTPKTDFELLIRLADKINKKKIAFFSATPRGGGVALMRHALIRLFKLLGVDASWHVMQERPEIFEITKKKFHNVLHGISAPSVKLTEEEKIAYESWIKVNAEKLHSLFHQAKVIVIDDPQPSGLVPHIKKASPKTKIVYRSHIQLETNLFDDPEHSQSITWNYIWEHIKDVDLFISHPIQEFVPKMVDRKKVVFMTASIDPLDGLNKPLTGGQMNYYFETFNNFLTEQGQTPLDRSRPYITQVARFDPSKGIPDVIESYRHLREMLEGKDVPVPQLIITGQGSVDDPEGLPILKETISMLKIYKYKEIQGDIKIARTPAIDQIQNTLMRNASIYLQLSHKEGFEDKITGALMMGVPAIIYNAGGMPLQVVHGKSGYIVDVGDTEKVAKHMFNLLTDETLHKKMSKGALKNAIFEATTMSNAVDWLYIANELINKGRIKGNMEKVYNTARNVSDS